MPDKNGYPTENELEKLRILCDGYLTDYRNGIPKITKEIIEYLKEIWNWDDYIIWDENASNLELHTGGWSGNEGIISILEKSAFWWLHWVKSERGGHHYFQISYP